MGSFQTMCSCSQPVPGERDRDLQLAAPAVRLLELGVTEDDTAGVAQADAGQRRGRPRQASQPDALGERRRDAAEHVDEGVHREGEPVPEEARGGADDIVAGVVIDGHENGDDHGGEGDQPPDAAPAHRGLAVAEGPFG